MTAKELKQVLEELPDDFPVHVIFDGTIDENPSWNVDEDRIYIEGVSPEKDRAVSELCR